MISDEVLSAVITLQKRMLTASEVYQLDRHDRALDELLRSPCCKAPVHFQTRSALAHAGQVLADRRRLGTIVPIDQLTSLESLGPVRDLPVTDQEIVALDILLWLETTPSLSDTERTILRQLAAGSEAVTLAAKYDVPISRMRERISRARAAARTAYQREVGQ